MGKMPILQEELDIFLIASLLFITGDFVFLNIYIVSTYAKDNESSGNTLRVRS